MFLAIFISNKAGYYPVEEKEKEELGFYDCGWKVGAFRSVADAPLSGSLIAWRRNQAAFISVSLRMVIVKKHFNGVLVFTSLNERILYEHRAHEYQPPNSSRGCPFHVFSSDTHPYTPQSSRLDEWLHT